jgi:hypothetical protein
MNFSYIVTNAVRYLRLSYGGAYFAIMGRLINNGFQNPNALNFERFPIDIDLGNSQDVLIGMQQLLITPLEF